MENDLEIGADKVVLEEFSNDEQVIVVIRYINPEEL